MVRIIGVMASCIPKNHPLNEKTHRTAGAANILI